MNDTLAPIFAFLIYGPLFLFDLLGLPVFTQGDGGWGSPTILGWIAVIFFYGIIIFLIGSLVAKLRKKNMSDL